MLMKKPTIVQLKAFIDTSGLVGSKELIVTEIAP